MDNISKEEAIKLNDEIHKLPNMKAVLEKEQQESTLQKVYEIFDKYFYIKDKDRIDVLLAVALSNKIPGTPLWMFFVGASGDAKSTIINPLTGLSNSIKLDQITKNTLSSGCPGNDLGFELQNANKILLFPDLSCMTSKNPEDKNEIWGQFRNLYDGFINKRTGNNIIRAYEGCHISLIACTTPVIENEILIHSQLGTRELMYKVYNDTTENDKKMDSAWENEDKEREMMDETKKVVCNFIGYHPIKKVSIPDDMKIFLKTEAQRLSILRANVAKDRTYQELLNDVVPEVPTRLIKQFKRLYVALKSLDDNYPDANIKRIVSHIVDGSGDIVRQKILNYLKTQGLWLRIRDICLYTKLSRVKIKGELEVLWNMNILEKEEREDCIGGNRFEVVSYYRFIDEKNNKPCFADISVDTDLGA